MKKIQKKLHILTKDIDYNLYLMVKWGTTIVIFLLILLIPKVGIIFAPIISIIYLLLFNRIMIDKQILKKERELEQSAETFFKVFTISFKKNRNVRKSLEEATDIVDNAISRDFLKILKDANNGKNINASLKEYKEFNSSETINNIIDLLIKYNTNRADIDKSLNNKITELTKKNNKIKIISYKTIPYKLVINCTIFTTIILILIILISKIY